jgi:hypothetical protein
MISARTTEAWSSDSSLGPDREGLARPLTFKAQSEHAETPSMMRRYQGRHSPQIGESRNALVAIGMTPAGIEPNIPLVAKRLAGVGAGASL